MSVLGSLNKVRFLRKTISKTECVDYFRLNHINCESSFLTILSSRLIAKHKKKIHIFSPFSNEFCERILKIRVLLQYGHPKRIIHIRYVLCMVVESHFIQSLAHWYITPFTIFDIVRIMLSEHWWHIFLALPYSIGSS